MAETLLKICALAFLFRCIHKLFGERLGREIKEWSETVFSACLLAALLMIFVVQAFTSTDSSEGLAHMLSGFKVKDHVFVLKKVAYLISKPSRGDFVLFRMHRTTGDIFSRVIGLPGDEIDIDRGKVYVNGRALIEKYVIIRPDYQYSTVVPPERYFVLADRRDSTVGAQAGSQVWGTLAKKEILGRAWLRYWPPKRFGFFRAPAYPESTETLDKPKPAKKRDALEIAVAEVSRPAPADDDSEKLIKDFNDRDWEVRKRAALKLAGFPDERSVEALVAALDDPHKYVRGAAAKSLGELKYPSAVAPLIRTLEDRSLHVRGSAAEALGKLGDPRAIDSLQKLLRDRSKLIRKIARESLKELEGR